MQSRKLILTFFALFATAWTQDAPEELTTGDQVEYGQKKLSETMRAVLQHYQQADPVGLPGAEIPEPYPVPDIKQTVSVATVNMKNTALYGIRKFRILNVNVEIGEMKVQAAMKIDKLQARGDYVMSTWLNRASGPFTIDIKDLLINAKGSLGVERDGKIRAQDITIDLSFASISVDFKNLGLFGNLLQGIINTMGNVLFDAIKPVILKEAYAKARVAINGALEKYAGDLEFPNSISPLDMIIADLRKIVRNQDWDPKKLDDFNSTISIFTVATQNTWITGFSSFQRVGNITLKMENKTLIADFEIGTQKLEGTTQWDISAVSGLLSRAGTASFSVEYINARIILGQPLDTRKKPEFRNLDLEIGNIQVRCNGAGTVDYVIELVVNVLPNLLRYQIMDAIEGPLKERVQQEFNKINVEETITSNLPKLDEMQVDTMKLSSLLEAAPQEGPVVYDEDEFFNF